MAAPTNILVTPLLLSVDENSASGTLIGGLSVVDVDMTTYMWSLLDDAGGRFAISGSNVVVANGTRLDYEAQSAYAVTVRVTEDGLSIDRELTITLRDVKGEIVNGTTGNDVILGDLGSDSLSGGGGNDSLSGGAGNDYLNGNAGADTMSGGTGNDTFYVDNALDVAIDESFFGGNDLVLSALAYTLSANIEGLTLLGGALRAVGNSLGNVLIGNASANVLDGKAGVDTMAGGLGNDTYYVDHSSDVVQETISEGIDTVIASVSYSLTVAGATAPREVENLTLAAGTVNINATGNAIANVLTGNAGANVLNGMAGADTMIGGYGNDIYYVDSAGDVVTEALAAGGSDTIISSVTYSIASVANVEKLTLSGLSAINATGNALANVIVGSAAANLIDGGAGNDTMSGGAGNDTYVLDTATDKVMENSNSGIDTIRIGATFTLAPVANVERAELLGTGNFNLTGNTLNNQLVGNTGANLINGGTGIDTMSGGSGNDTYVVDNMFDAVVEAAGAGTDTVQAQISHVLGANVENLTLFNAAWLGAGNALANSIIGNGVLNKLDGGAGNDTINGGGGNDTISGGTGLDRLSGGLGNDWFYFDTAPNSASNVDTITDFVAGSDSIRLAKAVFAAAGPVGALSVNAFVAGTAATSAASRIIYDKATGNVWYDADGTGGGAAVKLAVIANKAALTAKDFGIVLASPTATLVNDNGTSTTDKVTNIGLVNIGGLAAGAKWHYSVNGGTTWVLGTGTSVTLNGDGLKSIMVRQTDAAGQTSVASSPLIFTVDTLAPSATVSSLKLSADTGTSNADFITKVAGQTLTGTVSSALTPADVAKISFDNGATWQPATAAVGATTFTLSGVTLSGSNTLLARVEDTTGHASSTMAQAYVLDTVVPTALVSSSGFSNDTGVSVADFITNSSSQTVTGTLNAALGSGDIVRISMDNGGTWQTATTVEGGSVYVLEGVVLASSGTMIVRVEDAAGNIGASRTQAYTLDLIAPTERVSTLAFSNDTGSSSSDFITSADTQTITGTLSAALAAGDVVRISMDNGATWQTATATVGSTTFSLSGVSIDLGTHMMVARVEDAAGNGSTAKLQSYTLEPPAPSEYVTSVKFSSDTGTFNADFITRIPGQTITGTLNAGIEPNNVVKISLDNGLTWLTATAAPGSTTFSLSGVTLSGSSTLIARVEDSEGRPSAAFSHGYTLDTTPPLSAPVTVAFTSDTGISGSDLITQTAVQTIWGTLVNPLVAGDIVKVSLDNGVTWQVAAAASGGTTFSLAGVTISGASTLLVRVDDAAGNIGSVLSHSYELDTTAPTASVATVAFDDTGVSGSDFITNVTEQTITGTLSAPLDADGIVQVSFDNGATWTTATASAGATTFSLSGASLAGSGTMKVRVEDIAGNLTAAISQAYVIDTSADAPAVTLVADTGNSAVDHITKNGTVNITGLEPGATWEYSLDGGSSWTAGSGTSLTLPGDGEKSLIIRQTDIAGNTSPEAYFEYTLDNSVSTPSMALVSDTGASSSDHITSDGTVEVTDLEDGASWQYSTNGGATWTNGSDTSFTLSGDGAKSVIARQTDLAGNTSTVSPAFTFVLDNGVAAPTLGLASDSGASGTDKITTLGTVDVGGIEAGSTWEYSQDGGASWSAGSGSSFTLTGDGLKSVVVRQTDGAGNASVNSAALNFTLDTAVAAPAIALASDAGSSASDAITNVGTVAVTGLEPGASWQYSTNGGTTWSAGSGSSFTVSGDGAKSVIVRQTDVAGNVSAASAALDFTLDTTIATPALTLAVDSGASSSDLITSAGTVNVSGLEAGATWQYSTNGGGTWVTGVGSSFTLTGDGSKSVIVRQTDVAGNLSSASATLGFVLDTSVAAPVLALASDSGVSASDTITNTGTVAVSGIEAGATWEYSTDGAATWTAGSGSSLTLTGDGIKSVYVRQTDAAGNAEVSGELVYTLDTNAPTEQVATVGLSADTGTNGADFITNTAAQTLTGTLNAPLAAGSVVRVSLDNGATWHTATASVGTDTYALAGATLAPSGTMIVRVEDAAGNFSTALSQAYTVDTSVATPVLALVVDSGASSSDRITGTGTVSVDGLEVGASWEYSTNGGSTWTTGSGSSFTLSGDGAKSAVVRQTDAAGNISAASAQFDFTLDTATTAPTLALTSDTGTSSSDALTHSGVVTVTGLEAGATWQYSTNGGGSWTAGSGSSFTLTGDGAKSVIVRQTDAAGNLSSASAGLDFVLDTAAAVPTLALASDTGNSSSDKTTSAGTVDVGGLEAGATWQYSTNGGSTWTSGTGTSFTLTGDGLKSVIVRETDAAGNTSANSAALVYTLDTTASVPTLSLSSDTGSSSSDKVTSVGTVNVGGLEPGAAWEYSTNGGTSWTTGSGASFTLTGEGAKSVMVRQTDLAGNASGSSSAFDFMLDSGVVAPIISLASDTGASSSDKTTSVGTVNVDSLEVGATWQYSTNGGSTWVAGTGTSFTLTGDGPKSVVVRQTDSAGNVSSASAALGFTLDTSSTAPTLALASDTGSSASDKTTSVGTVNVAGLESGATWEYSTNGGSTWTAGSGSSFALTGDGLKSVVIRQTDVAGNTSPASAAFAYTLDTTAAAAPGLALASDTGSSSSDKTTSSGVVTVSGVEAGATWQYSTNGGSTWTAGSGTSFTLTGDGAKAVVVRQTDAAGNTSAASGTFDFDLDTTSAAPTMALASDTGSSSTDKYTSVGTVNVGGLEAGATWQYSTNGGSTWIAGSGTSFTLTGAGAKSVVVRQTDAAGNVSAASGALAFTLDTAAVVPTLSLATDSGSSSSDEITNAGTVNVGGLEAGSTWQYSTNDGSTWTAGSGTSFALSGDGAKSVVVRQTDKAGNTSAASASFDYTLDTTPGAAPTVSLVADTGGSATDKVTKNGTFNVGGIEVGSSWQFSTDGGASWTAGSGPSGTVAGDGAKSVLVQQIDVAGNVSASSTALDFTLDTVANAPTLSLSSDTGVSASDLITRTGIVNVSGLEGGTWQYSTNGGSTWIVGSGSSFTLTDTGAKSVLVKQTDSAGNASAISSPFTFKLDATKTTVNSIVSNGTASSTSGTLTFKFNEEVTGFTAADVTINTISSGTVTKGVLTDLGVTSGVHTFTLTFTKSVAGSTFKATVVGGSYTDLAGNTGNAKAVASLKPAGVAGEEINLGLDTLSDDGLSYVVVKALDLPAGWTLGGGVRLTDGTWQISADQLANATVTTPTSFHGAAVLGLAVTSVYADGHTTSTTIANNIETFAAGNPIFAWAGDDNLTGSSGADTFVLADPIGSDVIYNFDVEADLVDLIAFKGFDSFADVLAHLADDASGNAVLTLAEGKTIRFEGVHAADLDAGNFQFNVRVGVENAGLIEIRDGGMMPLAGLVHNTGTIALLGTVEGALLQVIQQGITLTGGGLVTLSDTDANAIAGTVEGVVLTNVDNTIAGAGHIGGNGMTFVNEGTIVANGAHALVIEAEADPFVNAGLAKATGAGGLTIAGNLDNDGTVWAAGSSVTVSGAATGEGEYLLTGQSLLSFAAAASGRIDLAGDASATLHFAASGFDGEIYGFNADDRILIEDRWDGAVPGFTVQTTADGVVLTLGGQGHAIELDGHYDAAGFSLFDDGHDHLVLTYAAPRTAGPVESVLG